jgi:hypothetical protein
MLDLWADNFIATASEITARRFVCTTRDDASKRQHTLTNRLHLEHQ